MADVRVNFDAVPMAPERYDADNERSFRAVVDSMSLDITRALQELKIAAQADAVLLTGDQTIAGAKTFTDNLTLDIAGAAQFTLDSASSSSAIVMNTAAGNVRDIRFQSGGVNRWVFRIDQDPETGSNAGSNLEILARADDGSALSVPVSISRSTGQVNLAGVLVVAGITTLQTTTNVNGTLTVSSNAVVRRNNATPVFIIERTGTAAGRMDIAVASTGMFIGVPNGGSINSTARLILDVSDPASDETALQIVVNRGGTVSGQNRVSIGAADSGGTGYRVLRIPN